MRVGEQIQISGKNVTPSKYAKPVIQRQGKIMIGQNTVKGQILACKINQNNSIYFLLKTDNFSPPKWHERSALLGEYKKIIEKYERKSEYLKPFKQKIQQDNIRSVLTSHSDNEISHLINMNNLNKKRQLDTDSKTTVNQIANDNQITLLTLTSKSINTQLSSDEFNQHLTDKDYTKLKKVQCSEAYKQNDTNLLPQWDNINILHNSSQKLLFSNANFESPRLINTLNGTNLHKKQNINDLNHLKISQIQQNSKNISSYQNGSGNEEEENNKLPQNCASLTLLKNTQENRSQSNRSSNNKAVAFQNEDDLKPNTILNDKNYKEDNSNEIQNIYPPFKSLENTVASVEPVSKQIQDKEIDFNENVVLLENEKNTQKQSQLYNQTEHSIEQSHLQASQSTNEQDCTKGLYYQLFLLKLKTGKMQKQQEIQLNKDDLLSEQSVKMTHSPFTNGLQTTDKKLLDQCLDENKQDQQREFLKTSNATSSVVSDQIISELQNIEGYEKCQLVQQQQQTKDEYGHFNLGDKGKKISGCRPQADEILMDIEWEGRTDGKVPKKTTLNSKIIRQFDCNLLIDYYESKIKFTNKNQKKVLN